VGYRVERVSGAGQLLRTIGPLSEEFPAGGRIDLMPRARVLGFSVEYLAADSTSSVWTRSWDGKTTPEALRVSISVEAPVRSEFQISRKLVIPIHVR
jgi:hypothetical protein